MRSPEPEDDSNHTSFSFGGNWLSYVRRLNADDVERARRDLEAWLPDGLAGKSVLDIGCGSGVHSLAFHHLGARAILSFDADSKSVDAAKTLWRRAGAPHQWAVECGSILDAGFVGRLGLFDVVYSWGVLHHTGALWAAIAKACGLVASPGLLLISVYAKGPLYDVHLALKKRYNRASKVGKRTMVLRAIGRLMFERWRAGQNPLAWNQRRERGMRVYHDLVDWLGGLPYEVATAGELCSAVAKEGLSLVRMQEAPEGGCSVFLFRRS